MGTSSPAAISYAPFGLGVATDLLVYSIPIPFIPFQLQKLHYENVSSRVGWLLFAYVRIVPSFALRPLNDLSRSRAG